MKQSEMEINLIEDLNLYRTQDSVQFSELKAKNPKSIISYLQNLTFANYQDAMIFLFNLSKDVEVSTVFIEEIIAAPKSTYDILDTLLSLLDCDNAKSLLELWLNDEVAGYKFAFERYFKEHWVNASDLESLVKITPNLTPWTLGGKVLELKKECIMLGDIPTDFGGDIKKYRQLISKLLKTKYYKYYVKAKNVNANHGKINAIFNKFGIHPSDTLSIDREINKWLKEHASKTFNIGNYTITPLTGSHSPKIILLINVNDSNYILKLNPYFKFYADSTDRTRKNLENNFLRADTPYSNALVDFYLKLNNSSNSADILFYDQITDSVLYRATEAKDFNFKIPEELTNNMHLARNSSYFNELQQLGVIMNDISVNNFISNSENDFTLIDSGHIYYSNPLRPMLRCYHYALGNLCGREEIRLP